MLILSYLSVLGMGVIMGLVGGGGAILTIPTLVYLFSMNPLAAISSSLLIVGTIALVGAILKIRSGEIEWKAAILFGIPSAISTYISRHWLVPHIPEHMFSVEKGAVLLILFSIVMILSGCSLACKRKQMSEKKQIPSNLRKISLTITKGGLVGIVTWVVGAWWGFLIVPALVMLERLPIKRAVATSLAIIAMNSFIGALGGIGSSGKSIEPSLLFSIIFVSIIGLLLGNRAQKHISADKLSRGFGMFAMMVAIFMISKQLLS